MVFSPKVRESLLLREIRPWPEFLLEAIGVGGSVGAKVKNEEDDTGSVKKLTSNAKTSSKYTMPRRMHRVSRAKEMVTQAERSSGMETRPRTGSANTVFTRAHIEPREEGRVISAIM
jgi:hypothetical protein